MEIITDDKVSKKFLSTCDKVEFVNSNFEIINDTDASVDLKVLEIKNDIDFEHSFKDTKIKVNTLFIKLVVPQDLSWIRNIFKYIDFNFFNLFNTIGIEGSFFRVTGKDYISKILYYLYIHDISLENVLKNYYRQSIKYINENYPKDIFDTDENCYCYEKLIFSKNLRIIKGFGIVAKNITFLSNDFVIEDDIRFKDLEILTISDTLDLEQAFESLSHKLEPNSKLIINCQNHLNLSFYRNLAEYINLDKVSSIEFYDLNNTGLNYEEFVSMLKENEIPLDKCQFHVTDLENSQLKIESDTLKWYKGQEKEYRIPDGIKVIEYGAFSQEATLDILYLPSTLKINGNIFNPNIKKIVCANNSVFKNETDLGHSWLVLSDKTLIAMRNIKPLLNNEVLEINILEDIRALIKFLASLDYDFKEDNVLKKIIINSPIKLHLSDKLILKSAFRDKFNKKMGVVFNIVEKKSKENEYLDEETHDFVDEEIQELIKKLESKKSLLKKEDQQNLSDSIKKLLEQYVKDLKSLEPTLKSSLKEDINFGKSTPEELRLNLMISLNNLLCNFFRKDYETFIGDLKRYQTLFNNNPLSMNDGLSIEDKINNILYIANTFHSLAIKEKLKTILDNTLEKAQEYLAKDMNNSIKLGLQNYSSLNIGFNNDISKLYEETSKYQKNMQPILDLYNDLELNTDREFSKELVKNFKNRLESFQDNNVKLIIDLFNNTLDEYQVFLLGILNEKDENIDVQYIKECIRYSLSPIELYIIENSVTNITIYQITNYLRNGLKIIDNEDNVDNDYLTKIILEIENKSLSLDNSDKDIIRNELKDIINKWISFLINGDYESLKSKQNFKSRELSILYLIIKDLIYLSINVDNYIENKNNYHKAMKTLSK